MLVSNPGDTEIEISDLFASIQGEGLHSFAPSVFVRFRRCNLACVWCDSKYTWDETDPGYEKFETMGLEELADNISAAREFGIPPDMLEDIQKVHPSNKLMEIRVQSELSNLVFTGGEPLIWRNAIMDLLPKIEPQFRSVEFETNGTISPLPDSYNDTYNIFYNVSPKLLNSGNLDRATILKEAFHQLVATRRTRWKFVVEEEDAGDEHAMHDLFTWIYGLVQSQGVEKHEIYLMPQADTLEKLEAATPAVQKLAEFFGVEFADRYHVRLWGAKRGV